MSELRDRLEALAARGTRRGADDVLGAAQRDAQIGATSTDANGNGAEMTLDDDHLPLVTLEPGSQRRKFSSLVAAVGIAALVGVGALAVTAVMGSGGAGSPEGAVRQLADAITHKDPLAAVDVLVPSEVRSLRQTVKDATQRAADLKIVSEASQPLTGVDLSVDHLQLTTQTLGDGYVKVVVTSGEISASTHRAQLSPLLQKAMHGNSGDTSGKADLAKLAPDSSGLSTFVVVVRQDGRWYVSPAYTALEYAREANDGPAASFGSAHAADLGADSPEAAVTDALHAWQAANWDRVLALAPPDELPVYDYRKWIDQAAADTHPDFTIDKLSTTATVDGDTATVALDASGTYGSDHSTWQVGGTCPSVLDGTINPTASSNGSRVCFAGDLGVLPFGLFIGAKGETAGAGPVSISVVRENGRWFVSPVTTALEVVDAAIQHIDQRTVYTVLGIAYELPPDATITLGQPFQPAASNSILSSQVYAFDGQAGEQVVGEINAPNGGGKDTFTYSYGRIFTAAGDDVGTVDFVSSSESSAGGIGFHTSVKLPTTGSYRLVLEPYGSTAPLTLWDLAHAPKALRDAATLGGAQNGSQTCTSSGGFFGGSETCSSSSITPTTIYAAPGSSSSSSSGTSASPLGACSVTGTTLKCGGVTIGQVCPPGTTSSASNQCLDSQIVQQFESGQPASSGINGGGTIQGPAPTAPPATAAKAATATSSP